MNVYQIMEEIMNEATPLETKRRIANQFKDKMTDKANAAYDEEKRALDKMNALHKRIRKQGGDTVIVTGDKIENFSGKPEVKKNQEAFNKATDELHVASKKAHKINNLQNLVNYYKTSEALEIMEAILSILDEDEFHDQKAIRRNAEKNAKDHAYKAKQFEKRSDRAGELGKERRAEYLWDKANDEWDKETAEQERAAQAHNRVEQLRKYSRNEALEIMEQICDFADNLFELDLENKQNISPNKIKRIKKDENGNKVEVVSVADDLFPYSGDAKQQFNQKVLAKINDMIEGTGSLEDLIQFVRKGVGNKKVAHEGLDEAVSLLETLFDTIRREHGKPHYEYDGTRFNTANKSADLFHKAEDAHNDELRKAENKEGWKKVSDKRNLTKNKVGEEKTRARSKQQIGKYNERLLKEIDSLISKNEGLDEAIKDHVEKKRIEAAHADPFEDKEGYIKKVKDYEKLKNAYNDAHGRELEDAEVRASGGKDITFRGFKKVSQARHSTKNTEGEAKTRERRANSRQIKKSIFRHNTKDVGEPEVKASSDPTLKYYNMFSGDRGHLGIRYHNKSDEDKIKASIARHGKKVAHEGLKEALEALIAEATNPITRSAVGRTLRGKEAIYNQHVDDMAKYLERAKSAKGYRAQVNQERADDAERAAKEANKDYRKTRGEYLEGLKQRGLTNPQAHHVLNKAQGTNEALELMEEIINEVSDKTAQSALDKARQRMEQKSYLAGVKALTGGSEDKKQAAKDADAASDEYNKHINMQLRRAKRHGKSLVQDKNDHSSFKIEEDLHTQIEKKYGEVTDDSYDEDGTPKTRGAELYKKAQRNWTGEIAKRKGATSSDDHLRDTESKNIKGQDKTFTKQGILFANLDKSGTRLEADKEGKAQRIKVKKWQTT